MSAAELVGMSGSMPESVGSSDGAADDLILVQDFSFYYGAFRALETREAAMAFIRSCSAL